MDVLLTLLRILVRCKSLSCDSRRSQCALCNGVGMHFEFCIDGSLFFEGSFTSNSYIEMLWEVVFPELENSPFYNMQTLIWQQDGAPPHSGIDVPHVIFY